MRIRRKTFDWSTALITVCMGTAALVVYLRDGWDRFIGEDGIFVGMTGFGASAPVEQLYPHFGITPEAIFEAAKKALA